MLSYNTNIDRFYSITYKSIDTLIDLICKGISYDYDSFIEALLESVKVYGYVPYSREHYEDIVKNDKRLIFKDNKIRVKKYVGFNLKLKDLLTSRYKDDIEFTEKEMKYYKLLKKIRKNQNWNDISGGTVNTTNIELLFTDFKTILKYDCRKCKKNSYLLFMMFMEKIHYKITDDYVSLY